MKLYSIYFLKECRAEKVIAFDPVKETFNILKRNIEINELEDKVVLYNCGVGESHSKAAVEEYNLNNLGGTILHDKEDGDIEIFFIDSLNLDEDITFMKVDVEGFEEKVIKGELETIKKYSPAILLEAWDRSNTIENIVVLLSI